MLVPRGEVEPLLLARLFGVRRLPDFGFNPRGLKKLLGPGQMVDPFQPEILTFKQGREPVRGSTS